MKTYVWLSPEKLKFINDNPSVLSLLYDLGLLPEEISARVRGYVEEEVNEANRLNRDIQQLFSEVATMFELTSRQDIDGPLRARIQEALAGVAVKRPDPVTNGAASTCKCRCHIPGNGPVPGMSCCAEPA